MNLTVILVTYHICIQVVSETVFSFPWLIYRCLSFFLLLHLRVDIRNHLVTYIDGKSDWFLLIYGMCRAVENAISVVSHFLDLTTLLHRVIFHLPELNLPQTD